jgi:S-adenosylmethionine:tRNA ribosyltransferase-isomerase
VRRSYQPPGGQASDLTILTLSIFLLLHSGQARLRSSEGPFGDGIINSAWHCRQTYRQSGGPLWRTGQVFTPGFELFMFMVPANTIISLSGDKLPFSLPQIIMSRGRMKTSDFDYHLPPELIAQTPIEPRDHSRLLVLDRVKGSIEHRHFFDIIEYLREGDVMVFNDSRVIPARLKGRRAGSGGRVEILLLRRKDENVWEALARPARRLQTGAKVEIIPETSPVGESDSILQADIIGAGDKGIRVLRFSDESRLLTAGEVPLPPYIHRPLANPERYQTVYARVNGSVAAPTAGLHFTPELLAGIERRGVVCLWTTLHVGLDTFRPVTEEDPHEHTIYREYGVIGEETAAALLRARQEGRRIICIGTTTVRLLEKAAEAGKSRGMEPFQGWVDLFILPGHRFRMVNAMVTNFHLPRSTLLMLVTAFAGKELIDKAYREAIERGYLFYSFGDAMFIL